MTLSQSLKLAINNLKTAGVDSPIVDAEVLLSFVLAKPKEYLYSHGNANMASGDLEKFKRLISRRKRFEPVAYIVGKKEFYGLEFSVNSSVLIPRPETELLVESALQKISPLSHLPSQLSIVDVGTGSGNIIISIAKNLSTLLSQLPTLIATDVSAEAISVAKENAQSHGVDKKITFLKGNLLDPVLSALNSLPAQQATKSPAPLSTLILVANLPYIKENDSLPPDVQNFEPTSALCAGKNGLKYYEELLEQLKNKYGEFTLSGSEGPREIHLFLEIDPRQTKKITKMVKIYFPKSTLKIKKDYAGRDRVCGILVQENLYSKLR